MKRISPEEMIQIVRDNNFPSKDFNQWEEMNTDGVTYAHVAGQYGKLPKGFNQWWLKGEINVSVVAYIITFGYYPIPEWFDEWNTPTASNKDETIAHAAASMGRLPKNFSQWDLMTKQGVSVFERALKFGKFDPDIDFKYWDMIIPPTLETCEDIWVTYQANLKKSKSVFYYERLTRL